MGSERISLPTKLAAFLKKGPAYLWTYAGWRARRALRSRLYPAPGWPPVGDLSAAFASSLREHFRSRRSPGLLCDWARRGELAALVPEGERARTLERASAVLERRFEHRGREVTFPGPIDWSLAAGGNLDWTWEINRHHFFVVLGRAYWYTGDEKYARSFVELLRDWMKAHPPDLRSVQWRSVFEVGVRAANWCWAHALFLPSTTLSDLDHLDLVRGLLGMGRFLASNLERHAWNNHLLLEARALVMLGLLYPELPGAASWRDEGLRCLERQIARQVLPDGVHCERSSLYHEIIASEILEHVVVLRLAGRGPGDAHHDAALRALQAMVPFLEAIRRPGGATPLLGDASRGDAHVRYDAVEGARRLAGVRLERRPGGPPDAGKGSCSPREGTAWLLWSLGESLDPGEGPERGAAGGAGPEAEGSRAFPHGGYWVLRSKLEGEPLHLVFDCGPFGDPVVPGHGHADVLSLDLAVGSRHFLVDPGMYSAHLGEIWRNFFRGTSAHNTAVVDGKDQTILSGIRGAYRPAKGKLLDELLSAPLDFLCGEHIGYRRLPGRPTHRRRVLFRKPSFWLIVDRIEGAGDHVVELFHHFHPACDVTLDPSRGAAEARLPDGWALAVIPVEAIGLAAELVRGRDATGGSLPQGWVAFESGVKEPAPVLVYRYRGRLPAVLATFLVPLPPGAGRPLGAQLVGVRSSGAAVAAEGWLGARLVFPAGACELVLLGPGRLAQARPGQPPVQAEDVETDGLITCVRTTATAAVAGGVLVEGSRLSRGGEVIAEVQPAGISCSFAFEIAAGRLDVRRLPAGGEPARKLRIRAPGISAALLDGAEVPLTREGDGVVLALCSQA